MSSAIMLKRAGFNVELIDIDSNWKVYGAGITITGVTLRAYKRLGLLDELSKRGAVCGDGKMFTSDGHFLGPIQETPLENDIPATGGILRPALHALMQESIREENIDVKLGLTIDTLGQSDSCVNVTFSDGAKKSYDIVVGADGIYSTVRKLAFEGAKDPVPTGQGAWRVSMKKPDGLEGGEFYLGHEYPCGLTICGPDSMYLWLLTPHEDGLWVDETNGTQLLRQRLEGFEGTPAWVRENMDEESFVNYRPLEAVLQPSPWSSGRIVLVGDSVHATTPHLASGAGMAVEGAIVLADELSVSGRSVQDSLLKYSERRYDRCRFIVEKSIEIGKNQLAGAPPPKFIQLFGEANAVLSANPF